MSTAVISFMLAIGFSAWIYQKFQKYSGNNTKQSLIATSVVFVVVYVIGFVVFNMIFSSES